MLRVVYDSLVAAAADLDLAVEAVAVDGLDPAACGGFGPVAAAWRSCASAWSDGIVYLTGVQRHLADDVRQVAAAARTSDEDATRLIWSALQ